MTSLGPVFTLLPMILLPRTFAALVLTLSAAVTGSVCHAAQTTNSANPPSSETLSPLQTANKQIEIAGSLGGIGAKLAKIDGVLLATNIFKGSPAERAGLQPGWEIEFINGISTRSMTLDDAVKLVRGPVGTEITLGVIVPGGGSRKISLLRDKVVISPLESRVLQGDLLLLKPGPFDRETKAAFQTKLTTELPANTKGIILDLRDSPGGITDVMAQTAGLFLPQGRSLWFFRDTTGRVQEIKSSGSPVTELPVVVLINGRTAGTELVASALQRNHRAVVVGQPSSGLSTGQGQREMVKNPDGTSRMVQRGTFLLGQTGTPSKVIPDKILLDSASEEEFLKAARDALAAHP
jgi:carboxyl-terminal processing protease